MEFPRRAVNAERALALVLLAASLAAAWAQSGSILRSRARDGRPWLAWISAREAAGSGAPSFLLAIDDVSSRRLIVLHVPGELKLDKRRTLERGYENALKTSKDPVAAERSAEDMAQTRLRELSVDPIPEITARLSVALPPLAPEDETAVAAALALKARARSPRAWLALARDAERGLRAGDGAALDPLLFALELRRTPLQSFQPARLPDEAQAPELLRRLLAPPPEEEPRATTAEVLNATAAPGLATRAAKMLRLRGVDVLSTGGARPRARTMVFDRVGDFRRAAKALAALDCPTGRAMTLLDPSRVVDVTVEIGADCAESFGPGEDREP